MSPTPTPATPSSSLVRLRGLVRKEVLQMRRDPSSLGIALLLPLVLLLIFGFGVSLNAQGIRLALVADKPGHDAQSLFAAFGRSRYFKPAVYPSMPQAERAMLQRRIDAILHLQNDFAARLRQPGRIAPIQLIVNGVDANTAKQAIGYVNGVWSTWRLSQNRAAARPPAPIILPQTRLWYNPEARSRNFLIPGLIAVIMTLIGALLTSMIIAREWERGTMELLLTTSMRVPELLLSKIAPYFLLGMAGLGLSLVMAVWVFHVPIRGSLLTLLGVSTLFMLAALGMGLLISTVTRSQFLAGHIAIVTAFLPAFILSGFIFDIHSMPPAIQALTRIIAARYYVAVLQSLFLAGDIPAVTLPNAAALGVMAFLFLALVRLRFRSHLG
ncbi:MAG: ABC transporter permease [Planctomycetota bacterium]|nr:MAG: ABC transporter permease [Planctomycetota bacterium]